MTDDHTRRTGADCVVTYDAASDDAQATVTICPSVEDDGDGNPLAWRGRVVLLRRVDARLTMTLPTSLPDAATEQVVYTYHDDDGCLVRKIQTTFVDRFATMAEAVTWAVGHHP